MKIKNVEQYKIALLQIEKYMDTGMFTTRADELLKAIQEYELITYPRSEVDPIDAIEFRMEQFGHNQTMVSQLTGIGKNNLNEVLKRKRKLSLNMIRAFDKYGVPLSILIREYKLKRAE